MNYKLDELTESFSSIRPILENVLITTMKAYTFECWPSHKIGSNNRSSTSNFRLQRNACQEKKESPTYFPEIGLCQQADATLAKIPIPPIPPVPEVVKCSSETHLPVYFDLETTGLERTCHITQLAFLAEEEELKSYVLPKLPVSKEAQKAAKWKTVPLRKRRKRTFHFCSCGQLTDCLWAVWEKSDFVWAYYSDLCLSRSNACSTSMQQSFRIYRGSWWFCGHSETL